MCMQMKIQGLRAGAKVPARSIGAKNIGSLKNQFEVGVTLKGICISCIYGEMGGGALVELFLSVQQLRQLGSKISTTIITKTL